MLIFFTMLLKPGPGVDPFHVSGHGLGRMTNITRINLVFYYTSKNNIILIKKIMTKNLTSFNMDFS